MTRVPEAAPVDHDGDLLEVLLEVFLVLMVSGAGPRSDPGELQSVVCIPQSRTAHVSLVW